MILNRNVEHKFMAMKIFRSIQHSMHNMNLRFKKYINTVHVTRFSSIRKEKKKIYKTCIGYIRFYYMSQIFFYRNICLICMAYMGSFGYICWRRHTNVTWMLYKIWRKSQYYYRRSLYTKSFTTSSRWNYF